MRKAVFCIAQDETQTNRIVDRLLGEGFSVDDVSVLFSESGKLKTKVLPQQTVQENVTEEKKPHALLGHEKHTKAPEGATTGTITGGVIGGAIGLLIGIGAITIPGLGAFIVAGPLLAALSGAAVLGGIGLIAGALIGFGIPEMEAKLYESHLKEGRILICVHCDTYKQIEQAKEIFKEYDGRDICSAEEAKMHN